MRDSQHLTGPLSENDARLYYYTMATGLLRVGWPAYLSLYLVQSFRGSADEYAGLIVPLLVVAAISIYFIRRQVRSVMFLAKRSVKPLLAMEYYKWLLAHESEDREEALRLGIL